MAWGAAAAATSSGGESGECGAVFCVVNGLTAPPAPAAAAVSSSLTSMRCMPLEMAQLAAHSTDCSDERVVTTVVSPLASTLQRSENRRESSPAYLSFMSMEGVRMLPTLITKGMRSADAEMEPSDARKYSGS